MAERDVYDSCALRPVYKYVASQNGIPPTMYDDISVVDGFLLWQHMIFSMDDFCVDYIDEGIIQALVYIKMEQQKKKILRFIHLQGTYFFRKGVSKSDVQIMKSITRAASDRQAVLLKQKLHVCKV